MKIFTFIFISAITLSFLACEQKKKSDPKFDDSLYEKVDLNFYKNKKDGKLFIKTAALEMVKDSGNKTIYYYKQVPDIDLTSFQKLPFGGYYAKDKNHIYTWDVTSAGEEIAILEGANPASFMAIANRWAKDTNAVYFETKIVKGLDPTQIAIVCSDSEDSSMIYIDYIRDNDQLFYHETEIKVPKGIDLHKLSCKEDLFGNPFLALGDHLYIIRNGTMVLYQ